MRRITFKWRSWRMLCLPYMKENSCLPCTGNFWKEICQTTVGNHNIQHIWYFPFNSSQSKFLTKHCMHLWGNSWGSCLMKLMLLFSRCCGIAYSIFIWLTYHRYSEHRVFIGLWEESLLNEGHRGCYVCHTWKETAALHEQGSFDIKFVKRQ